MNHDDIKNTFKGISLGHGESEEFELDDFTVRVTAEHDPDSSINDYDSDGKVSTHCYNYHSEAREPRPAGFTGRARKIQVDRGYWMWWEPYEELTETQIVEELPRIRELLEFGFSGVHVELLSEVTDQFGGTHQVVVAEDYMTGCDLTSDNSDYFAGMVAGMVSNCLFELTGQLDADALVEVG